MGRSTEDGGVGEVNETFAAIAAGVTY